MAIFNLPFQPGDILYSDAVNQISNHKHDGITDQTGHADFIDDAQLDPANDQIKSRFYGWYNRVQVAAGSGLAIVYTAGKVVVGQALIDIAPGTLFLPANSTRFVYISETGVVALAPTLPTNCVPLAVVVTGGSAINQVTDLRSQAADRIIQIPVQPRTPVGVCQMYLGVTAPTGWLFMDGSWVNKADYVDLYVHLQGLPALLNETATQFQVPDMRNRTPRYTTLGQKAGNDSISLTNSNLPLHTHGVNDAGHTHSIHDPTHNHIGYQLPHSHTVNDPGHGHNLAGFTYDTDASEGSDGNGSAYRPLSGNTYAATTGISVLPAQPSVVVEAAATNIGIYAANSNVTINPAGSSTPFNITNPYYGINFIIKC